MNQTYTLYAIVFTSDRTVCMNQATRRYALFECEGAALAAMESTTCPEGEERIVIPVKVTVEPLSVTV